jgi:DNA invertase Pin-like site-specific DNA recombinase
MIYGYARVSTDGQRVAAQVAALNAAGADKVFREVASGPRPNGHAHFLERMRSCKRLNCRTDFMRCP